MTCPRLKNLLSMRFLRAFVLLFCSLSLCLWFGSFPVSAVSLSPSVTHVQGSAGQPFYSLYVDGYILTASGLGYTSLSGSGSRISAVEIYDSSSAGSSMSWNSGDYIQVLYGFESNGICSTTDMADFGLFSYVDNTARFVDWEIVGQQSVNGSSCVTTIRVTFIANQNAVRSFIKIKPFIWDYTTYLTKFAVLSWNIYRPVGTTVNVTPPDVDVTVNQQQVVDAINQTTVAQNAKLDAIEKSSQAQLEQSQKQTEALEKQNQQQQEQYDQEKQEESDRENQGKEDADKVAGTFNFSLMNPFDGIFGLFKSGECVSIPIIAGMVGSDNTTYCSWFPSSVRSILTPAFGIASVMVLFGFVSKWLGGSETIRFDKGA